MSKGHAKLIQDLAFYKDRTNESIFIPYIKFVCDMGYEYEGNWWKTVSVFFYIHW